MKYKDLEKFAENYKSAIWLDDLMGPKARTIWRRIGLYSSFVLASAILIEPNFVKENLLKFEGAFFLFSLVVIKMFLLEMFYYSHVFMLAVSSKNTKRKNSFFPVTYDVAKIMFNTPPNDVVSGFINSSLGSISLQRLDISKEDLSKFLSLRRDKLNTNLFDVTSSSEIIRFSDYAMSVYRSSPEFATFLLTCGITEKTWIGVTNWISRMRYREMREKRFWSREVMGRVPSLGKDWAYGKAWNLMKYANLIQEEFFYRETDESLFVFYKNEFESLEVALVKNTGANAIIISEDPKNSSELVAMLGMAIDRGYAYSELEKKRVFYLRSTNFLSGINDKESFENLLVKILQEARDVGNVILAIENFALIVDYANKFDSDIISIFGIFFNSPNLHIIALSDKDKYHNSIETNRSLVSFFEKIDIPEKDKDAVARILEDEVLSLESKNNVFVTYPALQAIVLGTERYFSEAFLYEKARDILTEIISYIKHTKKYTITKEDVQKFFSDKTGIPQGEIKEDEKEKLVNLEVALHKRIIGQDEAISSIANSLRRSRAGVGNTRRPIGSFLFLGPTGVGKTETTKALAQTFFGSEDSILRFDMSEYNTDEALKRLIGSFEEGRSGLLSKAIRDKPYSILLLDEFEKTNKDVHDLFLQIIDEGFFSDMDGNKVNVRNTIIIATSNAGSDLIFDYVKRGENIINKKDEIISNIISQGIFKPELINRFDGTILFNPLSETDLKKIAGLMLIRLEDRLKEKGIRISITDKLITSVVKQGMDQTFGARPMNRYIQEKIESKIADKIIRGEISAGEIVSLDSES
jgi:ATP-dependent Clp protease ATP-binding subunit ClpC